MLVHYSNSETEADAVVADIRNAGGRAEKVGADLRQADGPHILAKRVRAIVGEERLHTENSHKFTIDSFAQLAASAGWSVANTWISDDPRVAMFRLEPHP